MIRFIGHSATVAIEGHGYALLAHEGGYPRLYREGEAESFQYTGQVGMAYVIEEALDVTGKNRDDVSLCPTVLDILNKGGPGISD